MSRSPLYRLAHPLLMLAGLAMLLSFPLGLYCDLDPDPHYTLILSTPYLIHALLTAAAFLSLNVGVAGLADHSGPDGRRLGRAAIVLGLIASVVGFFLEATHAFVQPTMVAAAPTVMNTPPGGPLLVGVFGGDLLILVGLVTLGVSAFRQRVWPRPAAVLLIIGMVAAPFGSVAALPMGIGLLWAGWSGLKARSAVADDPARRQSLPA